MEENQYREEIVYVYVKDFTYKDKQFEEMMGGHPKTGRIYRAFHDTEANLYRIVLEEEDKNDHGMAGIILNKLQSEDPRWSADLSVLAGEDILNYDIVSEDYIKLAKWADNNNEDIDYLRVDAEGGNASINSDPHTGVTTIIFDQEEEMDEEWVDVTKNLADLADVDYELAKAVDKTIEGIIHYLEQSRPDNPDLNFPISNHPRHGKGANISLAVEALSDYLNHDPAAKGTLNKAVYYLLRELARINK